VENVGAFKRKSTGRRGSLPPAPPLALYKIDDTETDASPEKEERERERENERRERVRERLMRKERERGRGDGEVGGAGELGVAPLSAGAMSAGAMNRLSMDEIKDLELLLPETFDTSRRRSNLTLTQRRMDGGEGAGDVGGGEVGDQRTPRAPTPPGFSGILGQDVGRV